MCIGDVGAPQPGRLRLFYRYLCVMGAHWAVALERASGVAVAGVGEGIVLDLVVPRLYQLKDGSIPAGRGGDLCSTEQICCISS